MGTVRQRSYGSVPAIIALRRLLAGALAIAAGVAAAATAPPAAPAGRYRCYQPPAYTVTAWFDLEADGRYRVNGGDWQRVSFDAAKPLLRWSGGEFAQRRLIGLYLPPGAAGGEDNRHTIVLARRADAGPGKAGWDRLQRCYLTTH